MEWPRTLTLRNQNFFLYVVFGSMAFAWYAEQAPSLHRYQEYLGPAAFAPILLLLAYTELMPLIDGLKHGHIALSLWFEGDPPRDEYFDVYLNGEKDEEGPAQPFVEVFNALETDKRFNRILDVLGGRIWYPYVRSTNHPELLDIPGYGKTEKFCLVLPHPWTKFMAFTEREMGANLEGTQYTHSRSVHLEAILAPFHLDVLGVKMPIFLGVSSSSTIKRVTADWKPAMNEIARHMAHFKEIQDQQRLQVFPHADIESMVVNALEQARQTGAKVAVAKLKKEMGHAT